MPSARPVPPSSAGSGGAPFNVGGDLHEDLEQVAVLLEEEEIDGGRAATCFGEVGIVECRAKNRALEFNVTTAGPPVSSSQRDDHGRGGALEQLGEPFDDRGSDSRGPLDVLRG